MQRVDFLKLRFFVGSLVTSSFGDDEGCLRFFVRFNIVLPNFISDSVNISNNSKYKVFCFWYF